MQQKSFTEQFKDNRASKQRDAVAEYKLGKATVRIHLGELSEEERKANLENATRKFLKAVLVERKKQNK